MVSFGMLRRVTLVRTDVSEELSASFIRVTRIGAKKYHLVFLRSVRRLLVTASVVPSSPILVTLMEEALSSSKTSVLTRATRCTQKTPFIIFTLVRGSSVVTSTSPQLLRFTPPPDGKTVRTYVKGTVQSSSVTTEPG
jgi:hypothetical protein